MNWTEYVFCFVFIMPPMTTVNSAQ